MSKTILSWQSKVAIGWVESVNILNTNAQLLEATEDG